MEEIGEVHIEFNLSLFGGLPLPTGITITALKNTTVGHIKGGNSIEATKLRWSKNLALSLSRNNLTGFQFCQPVLHDPVTVRWGDRVSENFSSRP